MIQKPISQLLAEKSICILCPSRNDYYKLLDYLSEWRDLEWKSGRNVTRKSEEWDTFSEKTVFFLNPRPVTTPRGKKYYMVYSDENDEDIPTSHVFTVEAFKNYIYQQGASSIFKYTLE